MAIDILNPIKQGLLARNQMLEQNAFNENRERQNQIQQATQQAAQDGLGSDAFKNLAGLDPASAQKLSGLLNTDLQGLDAAFEDMTVFKTLFEQDKGRAVNFLADRVQTVKNLGRDASHSERLLNLAMVDPEAAYGEANSFLSIPEQLKTQDKKRVQNSRDVQGGTIITYSDGSQEFKKFGEEVAQAAIDVAQRELPKLTSSMQNKQLEFQESANNAYSLAEKTSTLADRLQAIDLPTGTASNVRETFLNVMGGQDEVSNLRKDYTRIRNKLITANLPQGPATDKDIELIAAGFPPPSASKEQLTDFLRAMSRGQEAVAKFDEFKSVFLQENGNITRAVRDFTFDGQDIKKGERLATAYKRINGNLKPRVEKQPEQAQQNNALSEQEIMANYGL